jgi:small redox-active disulfide protein 2
MLIEILGTGCAKCQKLEETAMQAVKELGIEAHVGHIREINQIMNYGVMITPALAVDGVVKVAGKVPSLEEVKSILSSAKQLI